MSDGANSKPSNPFAAAAEAFNQAAQVAQGASNLASSAIDSASQATQQLLDQTTQSVGNTLENTANNPAVKFATDKLGAKWLKALLGGVEIEKVQVKVKQFQDKYPTETPSQIAHRLIVDKAMFAAGVGFATNIIPPIAATLFGIELAANTLMQAEMVYEIAGAYGLDLTESKRRGEVAAIFALALGSDTVKAGLGLIELIPGVGAVVGASSNAMMFYALGFAANRFYEAKSKVPVTTVDGEIMDNR